MKLSNIPVKQLDDESLRKQLVYDGFKNTLDEKAFLNWAQLIREGDTIPPQQEAYFTASVSLRPEDKTVENVENFANMVQKIKAGDIDYETIQDVDPAADNTDIEVECKFSDPQTFEQDCAGEFASLPCDDLNILVKVGSYMNAKEETVQRILGITREEFAIGKEFQNMYIVYLKTTKALHRAFIRIKPDANSKCSEC